MRAVRSSRSRTRWRLTCLAAAAVVAAATLASGSSPRRAGGRVLPDEGGWRHSWLDGATFYQVFVRSFADSDGDGIGDLQGLISRLDHLNDGDPSTSTDLGVRGIWLMPIFDSPSYHGYDVVDYETIDPDYGTLDDFAELVEEGRRRGIRVILDLVLNHSSSQHPWFVDSSASPASPYRDWYVWSAGNPGWTPPWGGTAPTWHANPRGSGFYYGVFWGGMPDLNFTTGPVQDEAERLARLWLDRGAAGFRLDAVRYLVETGPGARQADTPETHAYWRRFSAAVRAHDPTAVLIGEAWSDTATIADYYGSTATVRGGDELPLNFNFPLAEAVLDAAASGSARPVLDVLAAVEAAYPEGVRDAPFLSNHDQVRTATVLGTTAGRLRAAASVLLTLPGVPFLYYGEEVGLGNGSGSGDEAKRTPMPWDDSPGGGFTSGTPWQAFAPGRETANVADQLAAHGSLLHHYRSLVAARRDSPALGSGRLVRLATGQDPVLAFVRERADDRVLVVVNLGGGITVAGPLAMDGIPLEVLYADGSPGPPSGASGRWSITLPPFATAVWRYSAGTSLTSAVHAPASAKATSTR